MASLRQFSCTLSGNYRDYVFLWIGGTKAFISLPAPGHIQLTNLDVYSVPLFFITGLIPIIIISFFWFVLCPFVVVPNRKMGNTETFLVFLPLAFLLSHLFSHVNPLQAIYSTNALYIT